MRSLARLGTFPVAFPLSADDVVESHLARILLLIRHCGTSNRIDGLTKLAKLDFFVRYPAFFAVARASIDGDAVAPTTDTRVESSMVRHHYGPWDKRYYHVLAHLESKRLIKVLRVGVKIEIFLTDDGKTYAAQLSRMTSFTALIDHMKAVKKTFGSKSGNVLKNLIYDLFELEVGRQKLGKVIQ